MSSSASTASSVGPESSKDGRLPAITSSTTVPQKDKTRVAQTYVPIKPSTPPQKGRRPSSSRSSNKSNKSGAQSVRSPSDRAKQVAMARDICLIGSSYDNGEKFKPGILELERRYINLLNVFRRWDSSSDISIDGSGFIELNELHSVLKFFYNWSEGESFDHCKELLNTIDKDLDGCVNWSEFQFFIHGLAQNSTPREFDSLLDFLLQCIGDVSKCLYFFFVVFINNSICFRI